jgi:hypothetical protein
MIEVKDFLDVTLRGKKIKGGRLGEYTGRLVGALAGSAGGPLSTIAGSEVGGAVANILNNNQLGSSFKMNLIRNITDDAAILKEAQDFLKYAQDYAPLQLPAAQGSMRSSVSGGSPISPPVRGATAIENAEASRRQSGLIKNPAAPKPLGLPAPTGQRTGSFYEPGTIGIPPRLQSSVELAEEARRRNGQIKRP